MTSVLVIHLLAISSLARETIAKINKWDYIKLRCFYTAKEIIYKTKKKSPTDWKKIFAKDVSDSGLVFKIHKKHTTQHQKKKKKSQDFKKQTENLNRHLSKDIQITIGT